MIAPSSMRMMLVLAIPSLIWSLLKESRCLWFVYLDRAILITLEWLFSGRRSGDVVQFLGCVSPSFSPCFLSISTRSCIPENSLGKVCQRFNLSVYLGSNIYWLALHTGYKVGRVDQAETALGAEMRVAADKSKGKASADKSKDKIVRRCAVVCEIPKALFSPRI